MADLIADAWNLAFKVHEGQVRKGQKGDIKYICHPTKVMAMCMELGLPDSAVIAGVLHDTLEDQPLRMACLRDGTSEDEIASAIREFPHLSEQQAAGYVAIFLKFGLEAANHVANLTDQKLPKEIHKLAPEAAIQAFKHLHEKKLEKLEKMSHTTLLIKGCDCLDNVRALYHDYSVSDVDVFQSFKGGREVVLWKYRTLADLFYRKGSARISVEIRNLLNRLEARIKADEGNS